MMILSVLAVTLGLVVASPIPDFSDLDDGSDMIDPTKVDFTFKPFLGVAILSWMPKEIEQVIEDLRSKLMKSTQEFDAEESSGDQLSYYPKESVTETHMGFPTIPILQLLLPRWRSTWPLLPGKDYDEPWIPEWPFGSGQRF